MNTHRNASIDNASSNDLIGLDDGPFKLPSHRGNPGPPLLAPLVAVHLRRQHVLTIRRGWISVDGWDATKVACRLLKTLPRTPLLLSGVSFGGFNLIDPHILQTRFRVPIIIVVGFRPRNARVKQALRRHFTDWEERWAIVRSLGPLRQVRTKPDEPPIFYESFGCTPTEAKQILTRSSIVSRTPEPLRVAGIIARGLTWA